MIPGLAPACRVYVGDSHFFAISGTDPAHSECLAAASLSRSIVETWNAFFAMLPDPVNGACAPNQLATYRLWNPRGASHRYTTKAAVRDEMLKRGYVSEGYGPDAVAMCVAAGT